MGKSLRPEHLEFFVDRMNDHNLVVSCSVIPDPDEYLFRILRKVGSSQSAVVVHLTDSYRYGLAEFYSRPAKLKGGSFVVLGMPHAGTVNDVIESAREDRIGVGHIGKFMGALNHRKVWEYLTPEERKAKGE